MDYVADFLKYVICNPDKNTRTIGDKCKPNIVKPTSIDELKKIVKYASIHSYKITTISGGHSYYFTREFPKMEYDKLIVVDMSKFNKLTRIRKNMIRIEPGVIVKDIKQFNKKISGYHCIHGECDGVGFGFWVNGLSGFSGISFESLQHGYGSDYIRKIRYIDSKGDFKTVSNHKNNGMFNALKSIGGEFGIITSIDVELIKTDSPTFEYFVVNNSKTEIVEFIQRSYNMDYHGNITVLSDQSNYIVKYCIIVIHNIKDTNYATHLIKNVFGLNIINISSSFINLFQRVTNNDFSFGYVMLFQNDWSENENLVTDVSDQTINNRIDNFYCIFKLQNKKYHAEKRTYIATFEKYYSLNTQNIINKNHPNRIKYLNVPQPGLPIKDYISPLSKLSYEQLKTLKYKTDPDYMFVTTFNAFA